MLRAIPVETIDVSTNNGTNILSLLRKQESRKARQNGWIPAFAGMTSWPFGDNNVPFDIQSSIIMKLEF